ncbi:MAG TPA: hypothetical protein DGG94_09030 [Micromonosporaceae bacterium]|nr:hypothetical protein [Micromonosporaceae bacterium]HCU49928.1 hypothetical protein [Micromonosporaceae bacterium]
MSFYWCVVHNRVETEKDRCPSQNLLGPYGSEAEARSSVDRIKERERRIEEEDARWSGDH